MYSFITSNGCHLPHIAEKPMRNYPQVGYLNPWAHCQQEVAVIQISHPKQEQEQLRVRMMFEVLEREPVREAQYPLTSGDDPCCPHLLRSSVPSLTPAPAPPLLGIIIEPTLGPASPPAPTQPSFLQEWSCLPRFSTRYSMAFTSESYAEWFCWIHQ